MISGRKLEILARPGFGQDHKTPKLEIVVEFNLFLGRNHSIPVRKATMDSGVVPESIKSRISS